jgi:hypothetical protein
VPQSIFITKRKRIGSNRRLPFLNKGHRAGRKAPCYNEFRIYSTKACNVIYIRRCSYAAQRSFKFKPFKTKPLQLQPLQFQPLEFEPFEFEPFQFQRPQFQVQQFQVRRIWFLPLFRQIRQGTVCSFDQHLYRKPVLLQDRKQLEYIPAAQSQAPLQPAQRLYPACSLQYNPASVWSVP